MIEALISFFKKPAKETKNEVLEASALIVGERKNMIMKLENSIKTSKLM